MDFFSNKMTFEEKKHEYFNKEFLLKKNFYQVWNKIEINPNETFSIKLKIIRFLFKFIFFLFGKKYWHRFQNNYLRYFMDTTGVFYLINFLNYLKLKKKPKNSISLISKKYIYNYFDKI